MNLEASHCKGQRFLQPRVIPLLLLIKEWSREGQGALINTESIVLLLETLHLILSKTKKELTLEMLTQRVLQVMKLENNQFKFNLDLISSDGYQFINLFKTLSGLIAPPPDSEVATPLIDSKNGVLGVFLKRVLQEYERLTFSQMLILHRHWKDFYKGPHNISLNINKVTDKEKLSQAKKERDLLLGYETLALSNCKSDSVTVELKALHLAMLLAHFNYNEESDIALKEAIRLAQLNENSLVLEHSLALLQQVSPDMSHEDAKVLIQQFIKNAKTEKKRLFVSTGKIQLTNNHLVMNVTPWKVLLSALSSQFDIFNSSERSNHKSAIRSSALLLQSEILNQYGLASLAQLPLQSLCHMMSHCQSHTPHRISDLSKTVTLLATTLNMQGRSNVAVSLLETSLKHLTVYDSTGRITECIKCLLIEIGIERYINMKELNKARELIIRLKGVNNIMSLYWSAKLLIIKGEYTAAMNELDKLLIIIKRKEPSIDIWSLEARIYLLQADVYYSEGFMSKSMQVLINAVIHCEKHILIHHCISAQLQIAQCQLGLLLVDNCADTMSNVMPLVMTNDVIEWKIRAYQLQSEVLLISSHQKTNGSIPMNDYSAALGLLKRSQYELSLCDVPPTPLINHIGVLHSTVLHQLENIKTDHL